MTTENKAAWISVPKTPLEIHPSHAGEPSESQVLIRNHAVAINPIDCKLRYFSIFPIDYPNILGQDVAGEVVSVGPGVSKFKKGDRVMGNTAGFSSKQVQCQGFQEHTIVETNTCVVIPDALPFHQAVTMPIGISAASCGLFSPDFLNLQRPTHPAGKPNGQCLLVWGGSSCVGSNAIQLAKAAGYNVVATSSPRNFPLVRRIGASHVFDYRSKSVVADLLEATRGDTMAGVFDAIGVDGAFQACVDFVQGSRGNAFIASVFGFTEQVPEGVKAKKVISHLIRKNGVAEDVWERFLPEALAAGAYIPATKPVIVGKGLKKIEDALELASKGLSAQKAVVLLE